MSIRRLTAMAAGGLLMTLAAGPLSLLHAQDNVDADAVIVREVTTRNLLELRLADMASKKSTNPSVKSFAEQMRTDHLNTHKQLEALVGQDGKPFRTGLGKMEPQAAEVKRLDKLSGSQFDQEYMASMIRQHQDNVSYFRSTANSARSTQVRALLTSGLPVLQTHLSQAIQVGNQVGAGVPVATGGQNPTTPTYPQPPTQNPRPPTQNPLPPSQNPVPQNTPVVNQNVPADPAAFKKDDKFVREAVADNTLEVRLAQEAQKKATQNNIRQLSQWLLEEHNTMLNRWLSLASSNGMKLKPGMGKNHTAKAKKLEKLSGTDFDKAYLTMQIQNNQDYVEYFQKEGRAAHSAQVRNQAAADLPMIQRHLSEAKQLGNQLGVDTTAALGARNLSSYK